MARMIDNKHIYSVAMKVESGCGSLSWSGAAGAMWSCGTTNQINGKGHRKATGLMLKTIKSMI